MIALRHHCPLYCNLQPGQYRLGEGGTLAGAKSLEGPWGASDGAGNKWCQCTFMEGRIKNWTAKHANQNAKWLHVLGLHFLFAFAQVCLPEFVDWISR